MKIAVPNTWRDPDTGELRVPGAIQRRWSDPDCCDLCPEGEQLIAWHDDRLKLCLQHAQEWGKLPKDLPNVVDADPL